MKSKRRSPIWKISKEELEKVVNNSFSYSNILHYFGLISRGGSYKTLKRRLEEDGICYGHIKNASPFQKDQYRGQRKPVEYFLVKG